MFGKGQTFEKLLDKATSNLKIDPDWPTILQICDLIRQGDVSPKTALASIKKKIVNPNPHTSMFALYVLESCVKNCGALIHDEIGTKAYMEQLKDIIKNTQHDDVKNKLLELIQAWAHAFRDSPKYRAVQDTVNILKADGCNFPTLKESDAMFSADTAPLWSDGENCNRCRVLFNLLQRKHHCRNCGQVFCNQCTSQTCIIPKFGIEKEVRVCDSCYEKLSKPSNSTSKFEEALPPEYLSSSLAQQSQAPPPRKSEAELKEEEDLNLAIALSQSEAESARKKPISTRAKSYSPPPKISTSPESDPELARYLNRSYWQQQSLELNNPSAPVQSLPMPQMSIPTQNGVEECEMEDFVTTLRSQVEIFETRMKSNSSRGRSISNDSSVQTLFVAIAAMHSKLLKYIHQQDDSRVYFEGLQDKLVQVKDARAALDALREEHREKLKREAEIAERQRQIQMAQKLDMMRKKKQEYLQYQRQLALQRIQEQEREMQIRQEQQKQQYILGSYNTLPYIQGFEAIPPTMVSGRFPNPGYPPYNPGAVDSMMPHHIPMSGPMMVGTEQGMMLPGSLPSVRGPIPPGLPHAPPAPLQGPHMGMPMAPPPPMNHQNPSIMQGVPQVPPMSPGPSLNHGQPLPRPPQINQNASIGHVPPQIGPPLPMGQAPPITQAPPVGQMQAGSQAPQPPMSQAPPMSQGLPMSQPPPMVQVAAMNQTPAVNHHIMHSQLGSPQLQNVSQHQQFQPKQETETTGELISFD